MPKFTTTASVDLKPVLTSLGMGREFGGGDFSEFSTEPTTIDQVRQRVYLGVGEQGTTAAAVTGGGIDRLERPPLPASDDVRSPIPVPHQGQGDWRDPVCERDQRPDIELRLPTDATKTRAGPSRPDLRTRTLRPARTPPDRA